MICGTTCVTALCAMITLPTGNIWICGITVVILGIGLVPISPVGMSFASELTFPISPATTNGILLMIGHAFGCLIAVIGTPLCAINPEVILAFYMALAFISLILSFFVEQKLKKLEYVKSLKQKEFDELSP